MPARDAAVLAAAPPLSRRQRCRRRASSAAAAAAIRWLHLVEPFSNATVDSAAAPRLLQSFRQYNEGTNLLVSVTLLQSPINPPYEEKIIRTNDDKEADRTEKLLHDSIMKIVRKREDEVKNGEAESFGTDFLGSLLKSHRDLDPKKQISVTEIIDECKTFYFAGQETTFSLLSWSTFLLSIHTDWQEKAREEVFSLFGKENPNSEGLIRLKTVNIILYETLRLYCLVILLTRRISSRVKLGKYELPANVNVSIPPLALHRNAEIWGEDALLFQPERFGEGLAKATNGNPMAFLGFGFGPRTCVGLNFTISEAKIALSMILQRYAFTLSKDYVHSPYILITNQPKHGVQILLQPL